MGLARAERPGRLKDQWPDVLLGRLHLVLFRESLDAAGVTVVSLTYHADACA